MNLQQYHCHGSQRWEVYSVQTLIFLALRYFMHTTYVPITNILNKNQFGVKRFFPLSIDKIMYAVLLNKAEK